MLKCIQRVRIEAAKAGLEKSGEHASDVTYVVGRSNTEVFRTGSKAKRITSLLRAE